ncbi:hypothetical protein MA16_Dca000709 [Dendrobium catenatum]|uniref:Uncharacterized protein n=1 Tax=Dendrobium catenatum TaxID=906689 RepID=A0A2I0WUM4_9ASPA|nr:hypothetical protein MA16_Dca000709 [Dendrobium catenatum]
MQNAPDNIPASQTPRNPPAKALFPNPNPSGCSFHSFISLASPVSPSSPSVAHRRSTSPSCVGVHRMSPTITDFLAGESSISDREFSPPVDCKSPPSCRFRKMAAANGPEASRCFIYGAPYDVFSAGVFWHTHSAENKP